MGYPVSVEHIKQLAMYAIHYDDGRFCLTQKYGNGDEFFAMNNIANILHRQNMESANLLSSEIKEIKIIEEDTLEVLDPVWMLKMCDHYELYTQKWGPAKWFNSEAYWIIHCIRRMATEKLPGYHDIPYDYKNKDDRDCDICWDSSNCDTCHNEKNRTRRKQ